MLARICAALVGNVWHLEQYSPVSVSCSNLERDGMDFYCAGSARAIGVVFVGADGGGLAGMIGFWWVVNNEILPPVLFIPEMGGVK